MPLDEFEKLLNSSEKETQLSVLEKVSELDNNAFWNPKSIETLIFNSYVGGACIYEAHNEVNTLIRASDRYAHELTDLIPDAEDLSDLDIVKYLDEENEKRFADLVKKAEVSRADETIELKLANKKEPDRIAYIRITFRVIANTTDRFMLYGVIQNITEQRIAGQNERRLFDNLPCGAGIYEFRNGMMSLVYQNKSYWQLVGLNEEDRFPDPNEMSAVHPDDIPVVMTNLLSAIQNNCDVSCDIRLRHLTRGYRPVHLTGRIIPDKEGGFSIYATFSPTD